MAFTIPAPIHTMNVNFQLDPRGAGYFTEGAPTGIWLDLGKSMPIGSGSATGFFNDSASSATQTPRGVYWKFPPAAATHNVSVNTKLMILCWQIHAPNRIHMTTLANRGVVFRLGSGTGTPPTNYRTWKVGGRDTKVGKARENPLAVVIDLNDSSADESVGAFSNTDIRAYGFGSSRYNYLGAYGQRYAMNRVFLFDTVKNGANIPKFTGNSSSWADIPAAIGTVYSSKITDDWITREGNVYSISCPIQIGDGTAATTFSDGGATVFWPDSNSPKDPRVRVTSQAFRLYANMRDDTADSIAFSGFYNCGNSYPPWDLEVSNQSMVTITNARFNRTGEFKVGSSVSGSASWDDCGKVKMLGAANLNGSSFSNPKGDHLLELYN